MLPTAKIVGFVALLSIAASGCTTLGPDYRSPAVPVQPHWINYKDPLVNLGPPASPEWWREAFQDPALDQLIEDAFQQNLTLRSAGLRVLQAQQNLAIAIGQQYPQQQQVSGSAERKRLSNNASDHLPLLQNSFGVYHLGFDVSWEADVWGRFRRLVESASAELDASVADYDGVLVSLTAQIALSYVQLRVNQARIKIATQNIELQSKSLEITRAKFDAGETSALDMDQAETLLNNTKATLPALEIARQQLKNSLAILLGKAPQELGEVLTAVEPIPTTAPALTLGMPQDLLRRRPDLRATERQLAAQSARIGYAVTDLYPHFSLGGSILTSTTSLGDKNVLDLFSRDSMGLNLLGAFQWNIFQYDRLKGNIRLQDARFQQLLVDYRNAVLQAQREVEDAIVSYIKSHEQVVAYGLSAEAAQRASDIATLQYRDGLVPFNTVINTMQSLLRQQELLVSARGNVATGLVDVYRAIGGGWEIRADRDPVELLPAATKEELRSRTKYWDRVLPP